MLVAFIMGFASGLPLLLTSTLLQAWLKDSQIDLSTIGLVSLLSLPYTLKFIWAPFLDCYSIPGFGRRKGWMLIFQLLLIGAIFGMGSSDPVRSPLLLGILAFTVAFFSASQDIVIDAYRREDLTDQELGLGSSLYVNGYRVGMLLASGGGLILSDHYSFGAVYYFMGLCLFVGVLATLLTPEPQIDTLLPASFRDAVILPFIDFLKRKEAFWILAFIVLYKIGDNMAATMTTPYYMEIGFTKTQIGAVVKLFGFWATIIGSLTGGIMMLKIGINKSLWIFGILQAVSTLCFGLLTVTGPDNWVLAGVIAFENLTGGMGTTAFVAFMLSLTNRAYTATQYALLSSFMGVPRVFAAAPTGYLAQAIGWWNFFVVCTLVALPGLLLLLVFAPFNKRQESYRSKIASFRKQG
ncbi:MAG: AmpG family muropeptide MFS transporter [Desulfobacterales bacterium CG07_land_8_20_14_0_80_52_14]|nr:MAG: AmpG family muropeptide MFS transporter [Desulfobacterales bacterium CG07_land_8_20_14_0_80_52_14]